MKATKTTLMCTALAGLTLTTSCIGSFALTNKVKSWNEQATDHKFLNELIFVGLHIVPVYEVTLLADLLVINSIEFWSGNNPIEAGVTTTVEGDNGKYLITTTDEGYSITKEGEETAMELTFDPQAQSWNVVAGGERYELMRLNDNGTVDLNLHDGRRLHVTPDAQGVSTARDAIMGATYFAAR